ncbi:MAG TPA: hypothetical protein VF184_07225 [Phycisphaeraceae bacterium]
MDHPVGHGLACPLPASLAPASLTLARAAWAQGPPTPLVPDTLVSRHCLLTI